MSELVTLALFRLAWRRWFAPNDKLIRVTGWRSCIIERGGERRRSWFCPWGLR